jgi:hypothetical protein
MIAACLPCSFALASISPSSSAMSQPPKPTESIPALSERLSGARPWAFRVTGALRLVPYSVIGAFIALPFADRLAARQPE